MPLYQAIILAIVQGLTEFLPISSSAHLTLVPWLLGWRDPGLSFDIALHLGTLVAVIYYFGRDWLQVIAGGLGIHYRGGDPELSKNPMLLWFLALGSVPVGVLGLIFHKQAEGAWRNPYVIGGMLVGVGILMAIAERASKPRRDVGGISLIDSLVIGLAQALAIVPGTSRSGITITAGLFRDLDRQAAARFSFLLSTPAIAAAAAKSFHDLNKAGGIAPEMRLPFALGIIISGLVGAAVIAGFLRYLRRFDLRAFIIYRIVFGIIVIALGFFLHYQAA